MRVGLLEPVKLWSIPVHSGSATRRVVRQMCSQATRSVLVTDSSKFGKQGFVRIFPLSKIDVLITDKGLPTAAIDEIKEMGIEVIIV